MEELSYILQACFRFSVSSDIQSHRHFLAQCEEEGSLTNGKCLVLEFELTRILFPAAFTSVDKIVNFFSFHFLHIIKVSYKCHMFYKTVFKNLYTTGALSFPSPLHQEASFRTILQ